MIELTQPEHGNGSGNIPFAILRGIILQQLPAIAGEVTFLPVIGVQITAKDLVGIWQQECNLVEIVLISLTVECKEEVFGEQAVECTYIN